LGNSNSTSSSGSTESLNSPAAVGKTDIDSTAAVLPGQGGNAFVYDPGYRSELARSGNPFEAADAVTSAIMSPDLDDTRDIEAERSAWFNRQYGAGGTGGALDRARAIGYAGIAAFTSSISAGIRNIGQKLVGGVRSLQRGASVTKGVTRSLDDLSSLRGAKFSDIEKMADASYLQSGWTKMPLKDGNGIRYFDGKGNSFQLNKGYPGGKEMHGGPYIKTTEGNQSVRIPLEGNPDL